ncbi:hypothetical protein Tco_0251573 [Tanacetum coccineum]
MAGEDKFHDDNPPPPPLPVTPTQQAPHTLSTIKLPYLKENTNGQIRVLPPKTAEEILARERERKVDEFDLEEMDLKWQVAMISMRLKKFYKKTRRKLQFDTKEPVGFDKTKDDPQKALKNKGTVNSGCSRHMTGNKAYIVEYQDYNGSPVAFGVKSSEAKNGDEKSNKDTGPKTNEEPKDQEDLAFLEELERLKRQENEANDAAEAFRKEFAQCTKNCFFKQELAKTRIESHRDSFCIASIDETYSQMDMKRVPSYMATIDEEVYLCYVLVFPVKSKTSASSCLKRIFRKSQQEVVIILAGDYFMACKKKTIVETSTTETEYVACCQLLVRQVCEIQNNVRLGKARCKAIVVTEVSIRSSLLFNDAARYQDRYAFTNEANFLNLALHGGWKNVKPGPSLDAFDDLDADLAHEVLEKGGSNEEPVNAAGNIGVSTACSNSTPVTKVVLSTTNDSPTTNKVYLEMKIFFLIADAQVNVK